ncbi:Cbb3-type cytochrome oxidase, cytochrome c subunit [Galbibacter orientalis DSM 19592]|uniref:Cbb3-type cytochrome oxidase, cytochrome c subunit n=1 Tax=Galbibacter orientalis DSM 19592 TaxID=926559 RepID=I3C1X7_9FLAO|nr:cbb3-type cytochrome c oxidase subunit II [Galbibacter orientalis]EIJ37620.1 Cbb3-type cytochrome oxidase, cytochrome c subunit [Galbibacter orientalis DSM 19592]
MDIFSNHKRLFLLVILLFGTLTVFVAIFPALNNQYSYEPLPDSIPLTEIEQRGKMVYIGNGCVACHTQQVRNVEIDKVWGSRPNVAADYAGIERTNFWVNTATLMGTERTGPDLTNIGKRQPSEDWHLTHLYQPRAVVENSVMAPYPWLFELKDSIKITEKDKIVNLPARYIKDKSKKVVATEDAIALVAYLKSLQQVKLPDGTPSPEFLYKREQKKHGANESGGSSALDGAELYTNYCASCHQTDGKGVSGAFPPLDGSAIVQGIDPTSMVNIIMYGYNAREEYGEMPAIGQINDLSLEELVALMNHERTSWSNDAPEVSLEEINKILEELKKQNENQ